MPAFPRSVTNSDHSGKGKAMDRVRPFLPKDGDLAGFASAGSSHLHADRNSRFGSKNDSASVVYTRTHSNT